MSTRVEFHADMSKLKDRIQSILKGPLRKEQIYFVNGKNPDFEQKESFSENIKESKNKIEFHADMSELKDKIQSILKGPLRKEQIYFVNGQDPNFDQEKSFSKKIRQSKSNIESNDNQISTTSSMKLK